jgi:hypothetical protein
MTIETMSVTPTKADLLRGSTIPTLLRHLWERLTKDYEKLRLPSLNINPAIKKRDYAA